jgi:phospho-N-acetylmuramoyl-pentapeptide-transferase
MTSFATSLFLGWWFLKKGHILLKSSVREYTPDAHQIKNNTPTMGGIFIILSACINIFIWSRFLDYHVLISSLSLILFGIIGLYDDLSKIKYKKGISESVKFISQIISSVIVSLLWIYLVQPDISICLPFVKSCIPVFTLILILWSAWVIVGTSNAVNLTDGLDGLATSSLIMNFATFSLIAYLGGNAFLAAYLYVPFVGTSELVVCCACLVGSLLGFLWYNTYPARVFMGDVGSLSLGAYLATIALMVKQEILLVLSAGLFVVETLSVIIQVAYYKRYKKRFFKMAPLHHHFELIGWKESTITTRFTIITFILCLSALITLKIR